MDNIQIIRDGYTVIAEKPYVYVDNQSRGRSGHMTHALAAFSPERFIDFNSNCSAHRWSGHSTYGWIEYRISEDSGKSFSPIQELPYAKQCFLDGIHTISVEKAVVTDDDTVVAFCLRNDATGKTCCEPWDTITVVTSSDYGQTWSEPTEMSPYKGRVYDARYHQGTIYALMLCYEYFVGVTEEHVYRIYKSEDNGKTFSELCVLPISGIGHSYASLLIDDNDVFHAYVYRADMHDLEPLDHSVSYDHGKTWSDPTECPVAKGMRNPQTAYLGGVYLLHGRMTDMKGFVLYTSKDGQNWDDGTVLVEKKGLCYYSNNVKLSDEDGEFLLVQYSEAYAPCKVNVMHMKLRVSC